MPTTTQQTTQQTIAARWAAAKAISRTGQPRDGGDVAYRHNVLNSQQSTLVDEIKSYHAGVRKSFEHQVQYAFLTGLKLIALKDTCDHGNKKASPGFMAIREQFLPEISRTTANGYMAFVSLLEKKLPAAGNIRSSNLLLENGDLPEKEKSEVLKAVFEAADGKSWTAFYRDLGMVRDRKPQQHHPAKPLSPEEQLTARKQAATEAKNRLLADLAIIRLESWADLSKSDQQQILDELIDFGHFAKQSKSKK